MNIILAFLLITVFNPGTLCDCKAPDDLAKAQKLNYKENDLIFLGRVVEIDDAGTFKFEVLEILKGSKLNYVQAASTHSCTIFPNKDEEYWLVYTNETTTGEPVTISQCGLSRSFTYPYLMNVRDIPPPPPPDAELQLEHEILFSNYRTEALNILKDEIEQLRNWRNEK